MEDFIPKLQTLEQRFEDINQQLAQPDVFGNQKKYISLSKEFRELEPIISRFRQFNKIAQELQGAKDILKESHDAELRDIAQEEVKGLQERIGVLENELKEKLIPQDPQNSKNVIVEIRAGTGGDEAGLFAGDLYRMYSHYAEKVGWKLEILSSSHSDLGGFKEIIFALSGKDIYGTMKFESGVHRVQRVPVTESSGRIHTSAASVAVLPEAEDIEVQIDPKDIKVDVYRSSGPGGQSVNTTDSAVRVTHLPTGMVVTCQDEKSQIKNKAKALKVLRARLLDKMQAEQHAEITAARRAMVSTGDRSAKIRTYNFPQNRVTDHRIGLVLYSLGNVLDGALDHLIESLRLAEQTARLGQGVEATLSDE